jgi:P4 family phage/plasmid primase-like protien
LEVVTIQNAESNPRLKAALEHQRRGFSVIILHEKSKKSAGPWKQFQTERMTEDQIRAAFAKAPFSNIGIVTGSISGVMVLDVDGSKGIESLKEIGHLPATPSVRTGSGGIHYYYRHPGKQYRNSAGKIAPGLDIRAEGGMIVAPPSIHPNGELYEWTIPFDEVELADPPEKLLEMIRAASAERHEVTQADVTGDLIEGGRNDHLIRLAGSLRVRGLSLPAIRAAIEAENETRCSPPLTKGELEKTIFKTIEKWEPGTALDFSEGVENEDPESFYNWYEIDIKTGNLKHLVIDRLAAHFQTKHPALSIGGALFQYESGVYKIMADDQIKMQIRQHLFPGKARVHNLNEALSLYKMLTYTEADQVNEKPHLINLKNGVLDVKTWKVHDHNPRLKSTVQIQANHDPKANAPRFRQYLDDILDEDAQRTLQEIAGYIVSGYTLAKKLFILTGVSNSGKSVFINVIEMLVGTENCSHVALQDFGNDRFLTAQLFGKTLNSNADLSHDALKNSAIIKMLTGGADAIEAQRKGEQAFSFVSRARLLFSCNRLPRIYNDKTAIDRITIVKFERTVPPENRIDLIPIFRDELDGILTWALEGLKRLMKNKFIFSESSGAVELLDEYKKTCDPLEIFLEDVCEIGVDHEIGSKELYSAYEKWALESGHQKVFALNNFVVELRTLRPEIKKHRVKKSYGYITMLKGIHLMPDEDPNEDFTGQIYQGSIPW